MPSCETHKICLCAAITAATWTANTPWARQPGRQRACRSRITTMARAVNPLPYPRHLSLIREGVTASALCSSLVPVSVVGGGRVGGLRSCALCAQGPPQRLF
jgi:hypothetical protein